MGEAPRLCCDLICPGVFEQVISPGPLVSCGPFTTQAETTPSTPPDQLVWCGSDGAVLFWEVRASPSSKNWGLLVRCVLPGASPRCLTTSVPHPSTVLRLLQGVGLLLVTLEGCWRWWEVGGAAALAPEVDGE